MSVKTTSPSSDNLAGDPPATHANEEAADAGLPVKGVRGKPWTNVRALAKEHSAAAMKEIIDLMGDRNSCVRYGAARLVLEFGNGKVPIPHMGMGSARKPREKNLKVTIAQFKEEKTSGTAKRDRELPVVQRRRKGPWDAGDGDGA